MKTKQKVIEYIAYIVLAITSIISILIYKTMVSVKEGLNSFTSFNPWIVLAWIITIEMVYMMWVTQDKRGKWWELKTLSLLISVIIQMILGMCSLLTMTATYWIVGTIATLYVFFKSNKELAKVLRK